MQARWELGFTVIALTMAACTPAPHERGPSPGDGGSGSGREDASVEASVASLAAAGRQREPSLLMVPQAATPLVPTGHFRLQPWDGAVLTHTWLDDQGRGAVPVTEARVLWYGRGAAPGELYVRVYAGDLDLEVHTQRHDGPVWNDDSVALAFGPFGPGEPRLRVIQITPTGVVADGLCPDDATGLDDARCDLTWESHVRVATDTDGTLNQTGDFDEEWNVEAAIPLAAIAPGAGAGARIPLTMSRCDVTANGHRACGSWGRPGVIVLNR